MVNLERKYRGEQRVFKVYTLDEAKLEGISPKPWRDAGAGDWCITDDSFVVECLGVQRYTRGKKDGELLTFSIGRAWRLPSSRLSWTERAATRDFSNVSARHWRDREARKGRVKRTVAMFAAQLVNGKVDFETLGQIYRPDQEKPSWTVQKLLKQENVKSMVREEVLKLLAEKGLTPGKTLDLINRAIELAEQRADGKLMLQIAQHLGEMNEMSPNKVTLEGKVEWTREMSADISKALDEYDQKKELYGDAERPASKELAEAVEAAVPERVG